MFVLLHSISYDYEAGSASVDALVLANGRQVGSKSGRG